jgi:hypothetical protein
MCFRKYFHSILIVAFALTLFNCTNQKAKEYTFQEVQSKCDSAYLILSKYYDFDSISDGIVSMINIDALYIDIRKYKNNSDIFASKDSSIDYDSGGKYDTTYEYFKIGRNILNKLLNEVT